MCLAMKLCFWLQYLLFSILLSFCCAELTKSGSHCNSTDNSHIQFRYNTDIVKDEHIVTFRGYYSRITREKYLRAALENVGIANWTIVQRNNPAQDFPSDFDVIILDEPSQKAGLDALRDHPAIKSVTAQRLVQRTIKYVQDEDDCGYSGCLYSGWRNHRARKLRSIRQPRMNQEWKRKLLRSLPSQITYVLRAEILWGLGITGEGIKIAIFDTGLPHGHPHFENVVERTDWTGDKNPDDTMGHGTFVAGIIGSNAECFGFAPKADMHIYRIFTNFQVSYTSWFLDAFNYAIMRKIDIVNLSIGGPDFMDQPFVDKVWEISANKIILVSAIGNDGPMYGTLNNPGDQMDVIGVGGLNFDDRLAKFSSRGMTTWELPQGYGRMKPDILAYGNLVTASSIDGGCRPLSGTSVASPVVAGALALIASGVDRAIISPASVKQALCATANRLPNLNMFEQGCGKLDLIGAYQYLKEYTPRVTLNPPYLDLTECVYMWPYCTQPLYYSALPTIVNITITNGLAVSAKVVNVSWHPHLPNGPLLSVTAQHCEHIWPWAGWLALRFSVTEAGAGYDGLVEGHVNVTIESMDDVTYGPLKNHTVMLPIRAKIIPVPVRERRLLWDQFHSLRYPGGYFPRDDLRAKHAPLDWHADHIHTNFRDMYKRLREHGFLLEVLGTPITCVDTSLYGALLLVDPEDEYFPEELAALKSAVDDGLSLVVFADWYNATLLKYVKFYDENTRRWWIPETGGSNIPALNDLLGMFQVALGDRVFEGLYQLSGHPMYYASGTHIHTFPEHGVLITAPLADQGKLVMSGAKIISTDIGNNAETSEVPILGLLQTDGETRDYSNDTIERRPKSGRLVVYGDSSCLESGAHQPCHWLALAALQYAVAGHLPGSLRDRATPHRDVHIIPSDLPRRAAGGRLHLYSRVLSKDGSGPRPIPPCQKIVPLIPRSVHAPPIRSMYRPVDTKTLGGFDVDMTETADLGRAWRGALAPLPRTEPPSSSTASHIYVLVGIALGVYLLTALWKRCGRRLRRRRLLSLAT